MLEYVPILDSLHYLLKFSYFFQLFPKTCLNTQENFFSLKSSPWPLLFLFLFLKSSLPTSSSFSSWFSQFSLSVTQILQNQSQEWSRLWMFFGVKKAKSQGQKCNVAIKKRENVKKLYYIFSFFFLCLTQLWEMSF